MQIESAPQLVSDKDEVLNVSVNEVCNESCHNKLYKVYYHQLHIIAVAKSDYIHNTFSSFFNMLKWSLDHNSLHDYLKGKVNLHEWVYEHKKIKSRRAHVLVNYRKSIMMYRYSLQKDSPVMVKFLDDSFSTGDNISVENNVLVISKNYDTNNTVISIHFVGSFKRLDEFLEILSDLTHRHIDFSVLDFRPVRAELFVRYDASIEQRVAKMIYMLYRRFGYDDVQYLHNKNNYDVYYLKRAHIMFSNIKMHIKTYRRKDYNDPPEHYYDHPKLEMVVYFDSNDTLEDAIEKLRVALQFFGSFISILNLDDYLIYEDYFQTTHAPVNDEIVELLAKESLKLTELYGDIIRDEIDKYLLEKLSEESIMSSDLPMIASKFGVTVRTLRYRLKQFEEIGIIEKKRVVKQQYVYTVKSTIIKHASTRIDYERIRSVANRHKILDIELSDLDLKILYYISLGYVTTARLSKILKMRRETIRYHVGKLISCGLIKRHKVGRSVKYVLTFSL